MPLYQPSGVAGPGSSTANAAVRWNSTSGAALLNSALVVADTTGALSRSGNGGIPIQGTNTNDSAAAGNKGEFTSSTILVGSAVSLTTATAADITSLSLTAGDWDVAGNVCTDINAATVLTAVRGWISTVSATVPTPPNTGGLQNWRGTITGLNLFLSAGVIRMSLAATTTVYLSMDTAFSVNTCAGYGFIRARRAY